MNRRQFIKSAGIGIVGLVLFRRPTHIRAARNKRPNIMLVNGVDIGVTYTPSPHVYP